MYFFQVQIFATSIDYFPCYTMYFNIFLNNELVEHLHSYDEYIIAILYKTIIVMSFCWQFKFHLE
uniref:Uncharacterized protein n=1 Tax=Octopus bimaculoides TaxID=37653 RepID=A0A0L8IFT0_OCTBM